MKSIGRVLKIFIGAMAAVLALSFAPNAAAAPESPSAPNLQGALDGVDLPDLPDAPPLPDWADDLLPQDPAPSPDPAPADPDPAPAPAPSPDPAPAPPPNPAPAPEPAPAPCAVEAKACIDLGDQTAWLQDGAGNITRGPVPMSSGRAGYETPTGTTQVTRKIVDEWSNTWDAPMPYSVYFSAGTAYPGDIGIAFHEGDPDVMSHGCIHLLHDDAAAFFGHLQPGDVVDVVA
ncbi:MAG: L,D-transpeptidase [Mycobacteriaceae bacterium]|uniref:L,D-transpeptidase n=1 Tax=Corynebacterium sp. TaxID=1720 RepID=UPI003F9E1FC4